MITSNKATAFIGVMALTSGFSGLAAAQPSSPSPSSAAAPSTPPPSPWNFELVLANGEVSKGFDKTLDEERFYVRGERRWDEWALGAALQNVDLGDGADLEAHLYAAFRTTAGGVRWEAIAYYKSFPGTRTGVRSDLLEFRLDASRDFGPVSAGLRAEYTPDNLGASRQALWVEARAAMPLADRLRASTAIGLRRQENGADYTAWNVGLTYALTPQVSADLRYYDNDADDLGRRYDERTILSLRATF